jgi:aryl sulfotransferase
MTGNLILIASYPKSGNTWVRLFFENLVRGEQVPVSINDIRNGLYGFERRRVFDSIAPVSAADLSADEIENLLPDVYAELAAEAADPVFLKVHDSARQTPDGRWPFPPAHVRAVLYLARHPFDVAVSWAHHRGIPIASAVNELCNENHMIAEAGDGLPLPMTEMPGSWSTNVTSWLGETPYPLTLTRYEDLCANPLAGFARLAKAAGITVADAAFQRAVDASRFDRLRNEENARGFRERPASSPSFFRSGRPHSWAGTLNDELRNRLSMCCGQAMSQLGYRSNGTAGLLP